MPVPYICSLHFCFSEFILLTLFLDFYMLYFYTRINDKR